MMIELQQDVMDLESQVQELKGLVRLLFNANRDALASWRGIELTVKQSQILDVCRICKQKPSMPLILNYGKEYACKKCLEPCE